MNKIIYSESELKWFYEMLIPNLKESEVHFLSLSARSKYLTEEERKELALGRTEMFERRIVRRNSWDSFLRTVRKFETNEGSYTTKNNSNIPEKAIICYFNINPADSIKAYREFNKIMNEYMFELSQCAINSRSMDNILYRINKQPTLLMNCYQKATGTRHWTDFDFDVDKDFLHFIKEIVQTVKGRFGRAYIIETKSGYHLLVSKDTEFDKEFNPQTLVKEAMKDLIAFYALKYEGEYLTTALAKSEIIHNKNAMIPLPGTLQGGFEVKVINK